MRHWKDFSGQPVDSAAHHVGAFEAKSQPSWFEADQAAPMHEPLPRKPSGATASIEEVTDRIFRRYAVH